MEQQRETTAKEDLPRGSHGRHPGKGGTKMALLLSGPPLKEQVRKEKQDQQSGARERRRTSFAASVTSRSGPRPILTTWHHVSAVGFLS